MRERQGKEGQVGGEHTSGGPEETRVTPANALLQRKIARRLQLRREGATEQAPDEMHRLAGEGIQGAGGALPHLDTIQRSFGQHDVSGVSANVGGAATNASAAIGANAYAVGNSVAFASQPDLHTAAHEAAHVVQQRAGVHLKGGVGEAGDTFEQHADAVADRVVAGQSAESLLGPVAGAGHATALQRDTTKAQDKQDKQPTATTRSTIIDKNALVRDKPPRFNTVKDKPPIPFGTEVMISDPEKGHDGKNYVLVNDLAGKELGWTAVSNIGDFSPVADKYKKETGASRVYGIAGLPVLVFLPEKGLDPKSKADVYLFFHGDNADMTASATSTFKQKENPAKATHLAESVTASGRNLIAIAPEANQGGGGQQSWGQVTQDDYRAIVDGVLKHLKEDLQLNAPIDVGAVSVTGHSGGGVALGTAAVALDGLGDGVSEMTLEEAGYRGGYTDPKDLSSPFHDSWENARKWLLKPGKSPKNLRVLSIHQSNLSTRNVVASGNALSLEKLQASAPKEMTVTQTVLKNDTEARTGDMQLESKIDIMRKDPRSGADVLQGTEWVFRMPKTDHWGVRDQATGDDMKPRGKAEDFARHDLKPGPYKIANPHGAELRKESNVAKGAGRKLKNGEAVTVSAFQVVDSRSNALAGDNEHDNWAHVDGVGWVRAADLGPP